MNEQMNLTGAPAAPKRFPWLLGCGAAVLLVIIGIVAAVGYAYYKTNSTFKDISTEFTTDLESKGYKVVGESFAGKGLMDIVQLGNQTLNIDQSPAQKVYGFGNTLNINAESAHDILFLGQQCQVNKTVNANLCFFGLQGSTLTIAPGVKVKKIFVNANVKVTNNGEISDGISQNFSEVYDFTALAKKINEKYGDDFLQQLQGNLSQGTPAATNK